MRKIKSSFNQKDRVICVTVPGGHEFYYQPAGSRDRILLFVTRGFSGSVFAYFRDKGRNLEGQGHSLTVRELYRFKDFRNVKLTAVIQRIPAMIDYVLREQSLRKEELYDNFTTRREKTPPTPPEAYPYAA